MRSRRAHPRLTSAVFQIFTAGLDRSLAFYRLLGLQVPDPDGPPHVAVALPCGNTLSFDVEDTIAGMHPGWTPPSASDSRLAMVLGLGTPAEVHPGDGLASQGMPDEDQALVRKFGDRVTHQIGVVVERRGAVVAREIHPS